MLSDALARGSVDGAIAEATIVPILKSVKSGQRVDRGDPDAYRGIAVGSVVAKLLSCILAMRLQHWAVRHGVIDAAQIGFMHKHSAEWHVLTLTESIKARRRAGLGTSVLFVDLKKAYDRVHLGALWALLGVMGVPPAVVALLRGWSATRRARVRVNGVLSDPFPVDAGLPQGDPLSPLLFNLYIEVLSRYVQADPQYAGVDVLGLCVKLLLYADDLAALAASPAALRAVLTRIRQWSRDFLIDVNTAPDKTAVVVCAAVPQSDDAAVAHAPLPYGDELVRCVTEYVYLGYVLRHDLDERAAVAKLTRRLLANWHRYVTRNSVVRRTSTTLMLQLFKTVVSGSINYLRSVITLGNGVERKLDTALRRTLRHITGLPSSAATELVAVQSRHLTSRGIGARERERLYLQLSMTPHADALAPRLLLRLRAEPPSRASTTGRATNWAHVTELHRALWARDVVPPAAPDAYGDIPRVAHVLGCAVSYAETRNGARARGDVPPPTIALPVNSRGSANNTAALRFGFAARPEALGTRYGHTPVSIGGPGCSGSLIAIADDALYPGVSSIVLGDEALARPPFVPARPRADPPADYAARFARRPCRLCGAADESLYHVVCDCVDRRAADWRADAVESLRQLLPALWNDALVVLERARAAHPHAEEAHVEALEAFATGEALPPHQRSFLLYWTLAAVPWPRSATALPANAPQHPAAAALGALFRRARSTMALGACPR